MRWLWLVLLSFALVWPTAFAQESNRYAIEIDLQDQLAYLIEDGEVVLTTPISTGRAGHYTTRGRFKVVEKERNHYSNLYGKIVDARGRTIVADADSEHARAARRTLRAGADALLHALQRRGRDARRPFAGETGVAWVRALAGGECERAFRDRAGGHAGDGVRKHRALRGSPAEQPTRARTSASLRAERSRRSSMRRCGGKAALLRPPYSCSWKMLLMASCKRSIAAEARSRSR